MKILLCIPDRENRASENLVTKIEKLVPQGDLKICHEITELLNILRQPMNRCEIAVLIANTSRELEEYLSLNGFLEYLKIILVLPNFKKDTLSKGYKLYPRFISHVDSNMEDVAAVLEKMLKYLKSQKLRWKGGENKCRS